MRIKKFDHINEGVELPVLDVVIDDNGNVYNGDDPLHPLTKGSVERIKKTKLEVSDIIGYKHNGNDGHYPCGIDKNGSLICVRKPDISGNALNRKGNKIPIPKDIIDMYEMPTPYWNINIDYSTLVPILSTGWVNTKIDMEIIKKVRRFSKGLGTNENAHSSFLSKLEDIVRVGEGLYEIKNRNRETVQKKMSIIMLLHFINEIKDFFTPSSAGFLFESFIAGLIPNSKVCDDNKAADVVADGKKYQIKLLTNWAATAPVVFEDSKPMDYYVICLKYATRIDIYILNKRKTEGNYYNNFIINSKPKDDGSKPKINFSIPLIKNAKISYSIDLSDIDEKIEFIAKGLKEKLDTLFGELSQFQYNVETIITGTDEFGDPIDADGFSKHTKGADDNIKAMKDGLQELLTKIDRKYVKPIESL